MPNRIIKETIHTSEDVNKMSDFQFRLWVSLITYVDDYGRGDARPAVIKGTCFPLRDRIAIMDIDTALRALADIGCVSLYEVGGKPYLYFPKWESHQRIQTKRSRFPAPPDTISPCLTVSHGEPPSESESEYKNPYPNPNISTMALNDKTEVVISQNDVDESDLELNRAIKSFIEHRKKLRKPMTDDAISLLRKELDKLSASKDEQIAILNQSIMQGWLGVFPLKEEKKPKITTAAEYEPMTSSQEEKMRKFIEATKNGTCHGV